MLTTAEILRKVRDLEIKSKHLASDLFSGEYHSAFKGKGMSFREVREYYPGDDIRFIDWNVSARFNHPFSKVFEEERELTVMLLIDTSASTFFGTKGGTKKDIATEVAAVLAFAAVNNGDKVGAILYGSKIEKFIPAKKGKQHALFIIRQLLGMESEGRGTELKKALQYFSNTSRQKSIAFILSDFLDAGYEDALRIAGSRHDLVGLKLYDPLDQHLPNLGLVQLADLETGELRWVDSGSKRVRTQHEQDFFRLTDTAIAAFKKAGSDLLHLRTDEDYVKILRQFFLSRNR